MLSNLWSLASGPGGPVVCVVVTADPAGQTGLVGLGPVSNKPVCAAARQ